MSLYKEDTEKTRIMTMVTFSVEIIKEKMEIIHNPTIAHFNKHDTLEVRE